MLKNPALLFLFASLVVLIGLGANAARRDRSAIIEPTPTPLAEIESLETDKKEVVYICPFSDSCGKDERLTVQVKANIRNPKKIPVIYEYTVSGGRIVGQGEKVIWDLSGARPGNYTITAAIDYGYGYGDKTASQVVKVSECPVCDPPCVCPTIFTVTGSDRVKAGETATFRAEVSGGSATGITYQWTVSQGVISEGQNTPEIKVRTTAEMTGAIEATVEIGGDGLCADCPRTQSATVKIIK